MFLEENKVSENIISKLKHLIETEGFDTDTICIDVVDNIGNIYNQMQDKKVVATIKQFIKADKSM